MAETYVRVKVWGEFACFTRPECKVERVSYECMTPSAARNILDSICWKPQMRWVVTGISVLRPIKFASLRRNEVQSKAAPGTIGKWMKNPESYEPLIAGAGSADVTQRNTLALRDVGYVIEGYPQVYQPNGDDTPEKYMAMFNRRVEKGQCFQRPSLGCREFAAYFGSAEKSHTPAPESVEIGTMLYDIIFRPVGNTPLFFDAKLREGRLDTHPDRAILDSDMRKELLACSYRP